MTWNSAFLQHRTTFVFNRCTLADNNVGLSGKLITDGQWDYYELSSGSMSCERDLRCDNGKCLRSLAERCDGKNDCGDGSDEKRNCRATPDLKIRLVGGRSDNEGRIEVESGKGNLIMTSANLVSVLSETIPVCNETLGNYLTILVPWSDESNDQKVVTSN